MPRVRVQARVSSVRVQVKSKSLKKIRVESTTHTSQVRVESLLIHIESELALKHTCCYTLKSAHRRPNGGSYELCF